MFLFQIWEGFRNILDMSVQSPLKDRALFKKIFSGSLQNPFQNVFNFQDNQWHKLWESHPLPSSFMLISSLIAFS